jgi:oxygen-dependent protoporphyrinogen oxidase
MVAMEQSHRSLTRAMLAARKTAAPPSPSGRKPGSPRSLFTTLRGGMKLMVDGIAAQLASGSVHLSTPVQALHHNSDDCPDPKPPDCRFTCGWCLETSFGTERFDGIILALPAWAAAGLLHRVDRLLSSLLSEIAYSSSITVTLGYNSDDLRSLPPGFGYLVPPTEHRSMLACTFVHAKFAGRTPPARGVLRCFLGGAGNDHLLDETDQRLTDIVLNDLSDILGLTAKPTFVRIARWRHAMAQYGVGHIERIQAIRDNVAALPGFALAGNAYEGIGVPDCIRTGQQAAEAVLHSLKQQQLPAVATG